MTTMLLRSAVLEAPAAGKPIRAVLTTSVKAADGYALSMSGARLERFRANPALLVAHDHSRLPVGNVLDLDVSTDRITGRLAFAPDDEAQKLEQRVRAGVIRAVSIGFDVDRGSVDQAGNVGSWELTEVSLVGVPMDASALIYDRSRCSHGPQVDPGAVLNALPPTVDRSSADALLGALSVPQVRRESFDARVTRIMREVLAEKGIG